MSPVRGWWGLSSGRIQLSNSSLSNVPSGKFFSGYEWSPRNYTESLLLINLIRPNDLILHSREENRYKFLTHDPIWLRGHWYGGLTTKPNTDVKCSETQATSVKLCLIALIYSNTNSRWQNINNIQSYNLMTKQLKLQLDAAARNVLFTAVSMLQQQLILLQPFYSPLNCVQDYPGEPVPER